MVGHGARRVVAVVGKGHLPGLVYALCGVPPLALAPVMQLK